jgi:hypothetical protein
MAAMLQIYCSNETQINETFGANKLVIWIRR